MSRMLSDVDVPPLIGNKVAHDVKAECCKANADLCQRDGTAEDIVHVGATVGSVEGDKGHAAGSADRDRDRERGVDNGIDMGMGSDGSTGMRKAHEQVERRRLHLHYCLMFLRPVARRALQQGTDPSSRS